MTCPGCGCATAAGHDPGCDYGPIPRQQLHECLDGKQSTAPSWWESDAQGIPLARVCERCKKKKLAGYRPEILTGYNQADVDEPIEPDYGPGEERW